MAVLVPLLLAAGFGSGAEPAADDVGVPGAVQRQALWDLGVLGGVIAMSHYRGASETSIYAMPVPFLVYRGEYLRANRSGVSGVLTPADWLEFRLSLSGSPPVPESNDARAGMAELGATLEFGPELRLYMLRTERQRLYFGTAVRFVTGVGPDNLDLVGAGVRTRTEVVWRREDLGADGHWSVGVRAGVDFSDRAYHGFFYDVEGAVARPERPEYDPAAGYGGCSISVNIVHRFTPSLALGAYLRWDNSAGAVFASGPLLKRRDNLSVGGALIWTFRRSSRPAAAMDEE